MRIVDIHNHILWDLDDGPSHYEQALLMANQATTMGISNVIATPHFKKGLIEPSVTIIRDRVNQFNNRLEQDAVSLQLHTGMEVLLYPELLDDLKRDESILTLNETGKYVLIELPPHLIPSYTEQLFYEMQIQGFVPILSHPERNKDIQRHPEKLYNLVQRGALVQISASNLLTKKSLRLAKCTQLLLKSNLVHLIASDAHNTERRGFTLPMVYKLVEKKYGPLIASYFKTNAEKVLLGDEIVIHQPLPLSRALKRA
ncbi:hypothetical protein EJF36_16375 [Bacillus sp. HMF5848]|uniref:tyrosine-protein phosphatase n=1 Tax=Bacillus sp. HMF5848 TaxID=2495421 RepID=UPI000F78DD85|nr:CpsB/CapC family capsule biosynthesis tyrosine phosphatase [Bacillus sp. HMF5848]RSK28310.1 hypothetical protein EJF36_16375 [Bacillus sp. HMF5848]